MDENKSSLEAMAEYVSNIPSSPVLTTNNALNIENLIKNTPKSNSNPGGTSSNTIRIPSILSVNQNIGNIDIDNENANDLENKPVSNMEVKNDRKRIHANIDKTLMTQNNDKCKAVRPPRSRLNSGSSTAFNGRLNSSKPIRSTRTNQYGTSSQMRSLAPRRSSSASSLQRLADMHSDSNDSNDEIDDDNISVGSVRSVSSTRSSMRIRSTAATRARARARALHRTPQISTTETTKRDVIRRQRSNSVPAKLRHPKTITTSTWAAEQRKKQQKRQRQSQKFQIYSQEENCEVSNSHENNKKNKDGISVSKSNAIEDQGAKLNTVSSKVKSITQTTESSSSKHSPVKSPTCTPNKRKVIQSPMSYSKAVKMGAHISPYSGRQLFNKHFDSLSQELSSFHTDNNDVKSIVEEIFKTGSGISDEEVRKILNSKTSKANKWELKKQLEDVSNSLKFLKNTTNTLMKGKNRLVTRVLESEKKSRLNTGKCISMVQSLEKEKNHYKEKVTKLEKDYDALDAKNKENVHALNLSQGQFKSLEKDVAALKERLADAERKETQASISLEVEKARSEQSIKQAEGWRLEIAALESEKAQAVKKAEMQVSHNLENEKSLLRDELASVKSKMLAREEELGRLVGNTASNDPFSCLKEKLDTMQNEVKHYESQLMLRDAELVRAKADSESASVLAASKDSDMRELMKGLGDIQKIGQAREEEANKLRKEAEQNVAELERKLAIATGEVKMISHEKSTLMDSVQTGKQNLVEAHKTINKMKLEVDALTDSLNENLSQVKIERELRARSEEKERDEKNERIALSAQMVAMTKEHALSEAKLKEMNESSERQWKLVTEKKEQLLEEKEKCLNEAKEHIAGLEGEIISLKHALNDQKSIAHAKSAEEISRLKGEINMLREKLRFEEQKCVSTEVANLEKVKLLEAQVVECQSERRRLHNLIQELRGNVRVFARVRPFLPGDNVPDHERACVTPISDTSLKLNATKENSQVHKFEFDRVFSPSIGQEAVFTEVSEFVQSALDGYNVCLFSYGQTGSGKTHTMQGSGNDQMRGIIPRAIEQVGGYKNQLESEGWKYEMHVTFIEIYNESIRDLLRQDCSNSVKHDVKIGTDGRRFITNLNMVALEPSDKNAVESVMRHAAKHRSVGATDMNAVSSRSHSVFTLHLTAIHAEQKQALRGTLNLVDLAGSERLDRSGATGDRAKEAMSINKSLSCLTDVFVAIGKKASHIPFRNSKLTYLLQPSLSGDGKTLMLVNLSPTEQSAKESLCSLRFASHVNKCELGKAKRSLEDMNTDDESVFPGNPTIARRKFRGDNISNRVSGTPNKIASDQINVTHNKRSGTTHAIGRNVKPRPI